MSNGLEFKRRLRVRAESLARNANDAVKKAAMLIDQSVVLATPVDTGRARSNWVVTFDAPTSGVREPYAPGKKLGVGEGGNAAGAIEQGMRVIAARRFEHEEIFITNNVHYIGSLNSGSSPQAQPHFVQMAISSAIALLQRVQLLRR